MDDIALVLGCFLISVHVVSLALAWRKCRATNRLSGFQPRVSLVRPVCGIDFEAEETLGSSFAQDYRDYEVLFCASRADDPAVVVVQRLINENPNVCARLLVGETLLSQNPKLNNMAKGWIEATGELVVFADSNLLLPPDYCARIAAAFAQGEAIIVSAPPVGDKAATLFGEIECAMLNTHAARWQFAASSLGLDFAQGKTLAFRRSAFSADLMTELGREPAEDAAATKIARAMGAHLHVLAPAFVHPVGARTVRAFWGRHVRWARLRRATFPVIFAFEAGCGVFPAILALSLSPSIPANQLPVTLFACITIWYGGEYALARSLGWRTNSWFALSCLVRDAFLPAIYVAAWMSARFEWRGHAMDGTVKRSVI